MPRIDVRNQGRDREFLAMLRHRRRAHATLIKYKPGMSIAALGGTFTRADASTCATYIDNAGIVRTVAANVLRDNHWINGVRCTLLEASRTNLALQSQALTNAAWATTRASWGASATTAPDGTTTNFKLTEDATAANTHLGLPNVAITVVNGSTYTTTVFAKAGERTWFALQEGQGVTATCYFNLATGVLGTTSGTGSPVASIQAIGNGWYRCRLTFTASGTAASIRLFLATGDGGAVYSGDGASGAFFWGAMMELGVFPASYIPTVAASVTRASDVFGFPFTPAPQAMTMYHDAITLDDGSNTPTHFCIGAGGSPQVDVYTIPGPTVEADYVNGVTRSATRTAPAINHETEVRAILSALGTIQVGVSDNRATESLSAASAATALPASWSLNHTISLTNGPAGVPFKALKSLKVFAGAAVPLSQCRAA